MSIDLTLGIAGSGGDGIILLGELLSKAAAKVGLNAVLTKSFGPQIRGGESSSRIRVSDRPLSSAGDKIDALMIFHWTDLQRFKSELVFKHGTEIIIDAVDDTPREKIPIPEHYKDHIKRVPFEEIAQQAVGTKQAKNMVMAGVACGLFNWPVEGIEQYVRQRFKRQGPEVIEANLKAVEAGRQYCRDNFSTKDELFLQYEKKEPLMFLSGNDAFAYGCLSAGCRFMAGYPITPATEVLEWMARELPRFDGICVQAEDEISAMCMIVGASYGGVKAMTATSGPGLSLKQEAIGLAVIAEIPVVIVDVQRGGPSTGLPTRTEQSDLNISIYGGHGDCPRVVLAATNVSEAYELAHTAFEIAEKYQTPVIVHLDQYLGHSLMTVPEIKLRHEDPKQTMAWCIAKYRPERWDDRHGKLEDVLANDGFKPSRVLPTPEQLAAGYKRFALTETGVSPMSMPGMPGGEYNAVGIEHTPDCNPSSSVFVHQTQSEKRYRKFEEIAREYVLFDKSGDEQAPKLGILTWGSTFGVCEEVAAVLNGVGLPTMVLSPTILYPLPHREIQDWLKQLEQLVVVECNYSGQFYHYIKAFLDLPAKTHHYARAGGMPLYFSEILKFILYNIDFPESVSQEAIQDRLSL